MIELAKSYFDDAVMYCKAAEQNQPLPLLFDFWEAGKEEGNGQLKIIFLIGPFRALTAFEIERHCWSVEAVALEVWKLGAVALSPQLNSRHFHGAMPDEIFLDGYLEVLGRCDAALLLDGWQASQGSLAELEQAKRQDFPVFCTLEDLRAWLTDPAPFFRWCCGDRYLVRSVYKEHYDVIKIHSNA